MQVSFTLFMLLSISRNKLCLSIFSILTIAFLVSCSSKEQKKIIEKEELTESIAQLDLAEIKKRGYITAIMDNSSTGLFLYKGRPMGYEYELLSIFADSIGVELRFDITPDIEEAFQKLNRGEGDIMAYNLTVTKERRKRIAFTDYHNIVRQVLIQRKPDNWRKMQLHIIEQSLIRTPLELIDKEIHVRKSSAYVSRLQNLADEIGGDIHIKEQEADVETETIIKMVANGNIDYSVADEDIALVNARYYPILDIKTPVSLPQQTAWGVRKSSDSLRLTLNYWIHEMKKKNEYYAIYDKYFRSTLKSKTRLKSDYFSMEGKHISPYDSLIKNAADEIGWDWKLLAAQVSRESKFDPNAESWAGAVGLMQLLPLTGKDYGVSDLTDPEENMEAGRQHLQWLQGLWKNKVPDSLERKKFILASYNVGQGHVQDAVRLARKYGKDTTLWEGNVEDFLLLKSKAKYYEDDVVKFGYCRCSEPVEYVEEIFKLYNQYTQLVPL